MERKEHTQKLIIDIIVVATTVGVVLVTLISVLFDVNDD